MLHVYSNTIDKTIYYKQNTLMILTDRALQITPSGAYPWVLKGWALAGLAKNNEAIQSCDRALQIDPNHTSDLCLFPDISDESYLEIENVSLADPCHRYRLSQVRRVVIDLTKSSSAPMVVSIVFSQVRLLIESFIVSFRDLVSLLIRSLFLDPV